VKQVGNTILAKGGNHILAKRDNSAWPKGSKLSGFSTYKEIRDARPNQEVVRRALQGWIENCKFGNCVPQKGYIRSLGLKVE